MAGTTSFAATRPPGLVLAPFAALRYHVAPERLAGLLSPPYDVIDDAGVRRLESHDEHNVVRLILPRDTDGVPGSRYDNAARDLARWRREKILRADPAPSLYIYEQRSDGHAMRGLIGAVQLAAADDGIILPHENTMDGPVADRLALTAATGANLEPIFLVYDGEGGQTSAVLDVASAARPDIETTTPDGVAHVVWSVRDKEQLEVIARDLLARRAVIADGHHRYATYLRFQAERRAQAGGGPWDFGLAMLVDTAAFGPQVHPIHRVIPSLPVEDAVRAARGGFSVRRVEPAGALDDLRRAGLAGPAFLVVGGGEWHLLTEPAHDDLRRELPADRSAAWRSLDVTVAHHYLISSLWRLADTVDVVGFAHDVDEALSLAGTGVALLLNPTPVESVALVAAEGERMPRKSTLFTPKPRTGLLIRTVD